MMMTRANRASLPFHAYSSFNKRGGKTHPRVSRTRNRCLDLWAEMGSYESIAEELDISPRQVAHYIKHARRMGDPRATRPYRSRRTVKARIMAKHIMDMTRQGSTAKEIAQRIGCSVSLVFKVRQRETRK